MKNSSLDEGSLTFGLFLLNKMVKLELLLIAYLCALLLLKECGQFHNLSMDFWEIKVLKHILSETWRENYASFLSNLEYFFCYIQMYELPCILWQKKYSFLIFLSICQEVFLTKKIKRKKNRILNQFFLFSVWLFLEFCYDIRYICVFYFNFWDADETFEKLWDYCSVRAARTGTFSTCPTMRSNDCQCFGYCWDLSNQRLRSRCSIQGRRSDFWAFLIGETSYSMKTQTPTSI